MEMYDPKKIGTTLAWGGEHFVYRYGTDAVLKFSKFEFFLGQAGRAKSFRDYALCQRYFGDAVLPTSFLKAPRGTRIAKLQPLLVGRSIMREDLADPQVRAQFETMLESYRRMLKEGYPPVDLIGGRGIWSRTLANIFLANDRKLYLIDTTLIDIDLPVLRLMAKLVRTFALARQEATIAHFLEIG
jgi:hypothetical protein